MLEVCDTRFCSLYAQAQGEQAAGNAPLVRQFLVAEIPTPWPRSFLEAPGLPPGLGELLRRAYAAKLDFTPVGVVPDGSYSRPGLTRVMHLRRPDGLFARLERREWLLPTAQVAELCERVLFGGDLEPFGAYLEGFAGRDLLVCTHGTVDVCCAKFGYPVYRKLREVQASEELRVWRCTHFGGHRFAPTLIDLPTANYWGYIGADDLAGLASRSGAAPVGKLRGWGGLDCLGQIADAALFEREGWGWLDNARASRVVRLEGGDPALGLDWGAYAPISHPDPPQRVWLRLDYQTPGGERGGYEAELERQGLVRTAGESGGEPDPRNQYRVSRLTRTG